MTGRNQLYYILLTVGICLLASCAKMGQPDGGWYDETPPRILGASPADKATEVTDHKMYIYFNEYIKLSDASQKVVVSPPQMEAPDIKDAGKRIIIDLKDSLKANTTYTIDFSDAISDNNEGNPLGNYTYSFSTGTEIDTMEVSGYVYEAENLEPIKGILVGLYDNLADSVFRKEPFQRVSRTDSRGRFVIKGIKPGNYRVYALMDADGNYLYNQKSEKIAFSRDIIVPSCKPDIRQDTIWRDSLHIENIMQVPYTHFFPDDIVLRAFAEVQTDRYMTKNEREKANRFTLMYSYGDDDLPVIRGLNFDAENAFVVEATEKKDTITYWLRDTLLVNQDTLRMEVQYHATDTAGMLYLQTDTLTLLSKEPYATEPTQMISYVSCHDDMCLVDRLKASIPGLSGESGTASLIRLNLLAQTAVFTSQGVPFMLSGEELLRTKQGVHNSFESPDSINHLDWSNKTTYPQVFEYYKNLISLRQHHPAFRLGKAELVRKHLEFLPAGDCLVAFRLKNHAGNDLWKDIIVILNSNRQAETVKIPKGRYTVVCRDGVINEAGLDEVNGDQVKVSPQSALIIHN